MKKPNRPARANDVRDIDPATVGVVMQNGSLAIMDRDALRDLRQRGHLGRMFLNKGSNSPHPYVRMEGPENLLTVARVITGAAPDEIVTYRNGSRLDLRRTNLCLVPRRGAGPRRNLLAHAADLFPRDTAAQAAYLKRRALAPRWVSLTASSARTFR